MFYITMLRISCLCCLYLINNVSVFGNLAIAVLIGQLHFGFQCQGQSVMHMKEFKCVLVDPSFANISKCFKKDITKSITETTINITLFEEITTASIKLYFRKKTNDKHVPIYHKDILFDGCSFLQNSRTSPIARYIFAMFKDFSNINHSCPYKDYILIDRCRIDMNSFKWAPVPVGEYYLNSEWVINGKRRYDFGVVMIIQ